MGKIYIERNEGRSAMKEKLAEIKLQCTERVAQLRSLKELEQLRLDVLGKKGELTQLLKALGTVLPEMRPVIGQLVNGTREEIEAMLENAKATIRMKERNERLTSEKIDVTMPGKARVVGVKHPMTTGLDYL